MKIVKEDVSETMEQKRCKTNLAIHGVKKGEEVMDLKTIGMRKSLDQEKVKKIY